MVIICADGSISYSGDALCVDSVVYKTQKAFGHSRFVLLQFSWFYLMATYPLAKIKVIPPSHT